MYIDKITNEKKKSQFLQHLYRKNIAINITKNIQNNCMSMRLQSGFQPFPQNSIICIVDIS